MSGELKFFNKKFQKFALKMIAEPSFRGKVFVVRGETRSGAGWWCEAMRHVKKTPQGIVKQIVNDGCMNNREIEIFEFDMNEIKGVRLWKGRVK